MSTNRLLAVAALVCAIVALLGVTSLPLLAIAVILLALALLV